ncbi:MAG: AAA family ATPase [Candidatus Limnocylindrales bacterium]
MSEPPFERADGSRFWHALREAVALAVVGAEPALRLLAVALLAGGHALVEDVPGVGKTLLARAFAAALDLDFGRVQGTPDLLPTDVTGSSILEGTAFRFIPGPIFTNVLLVDEINRATPRTQAALLEAMQEHQVSVDGRTRPLDEPFLVVATQNPIELDGTFALPEAQLDRFLVRVALGYPDREAERAIARRYQDAAEPLAAIPATTGRADLLALRDRARRIRVSADVEGYGVDLVRATRDDPAVRLGASPRAAVGLYRAGQAWALLEGRDFVRPDDIRAVAPAVISHRLMLDLDQQLRGATAASVVERLLERVPLPVAEAP